MDKEQLKEKIIEVMRTIYDPEIPVNIYDLGLVYDIEIDDDNQAFIKMTLTSPACPVAESLPPQVRDAVKSVIGIKDATVEVVWDPPWSTDMMTDEAKVELGLF
ncbi:MAG: SUF system Fe-S cluster assembly protein [Calditrichia bacterium]